MLQRSPCAAAALPKPPLERKPPRAIIDFETRSAADLKRVGAWLYSRHHTTQILCLSYWLPGMNPAKPKLWHRAHPELGIKESPPPQDLFDYIASGGPIEAHNAEFEIDIWENIAVPDHGWPGIAPEQWMCSAAKAAGHSLPRSLEGACDALNLPINKDPRGKTLLRTYSQPNARLMRVARELFDDEEPVWNEDADGLAQLWDYCRQDVRAEIRLSETLPDLSPMEMQVWRITRNMNRRGILIDTELAEAALDLVKQARDELNAELFKLTGIKSGTQRKLIVSWLADNELLELPNTESKTLQWFLQHEEMTPRAARVVEIMKEVNRTSTNKFKRMLECVDTDERARELLLYCGADRTGRFSGRGIQIQNLPKGKFTLPLSKADKGNAIDLAVADVKSRDLAWCKAMHGDVLNLIVSCLRGALIAPPGRELLTADYAAIEARCVLWEAGADTALNVFREGKDIYCDMASGIYGREITKETAQPINAMGSTERDFGKVAVLGLGYGMGYIKFLLTLRTYNITLTRPEVQRMMGAKKLRKYETAVRRRLFPKREEFDYEKQFKKAEREAALNRRKLADEREDAAKVLHELALCKYTVDTYRSRYPEVPAMWKAQEAAAIQAVQTGKKVRCGVVTWYVKGRFLRCRLPSGRELKYCDPEIKKAKTSWGEVRPSLRFMGTDQKTKRWCRQGTYGGKLTENITQAIARDVMAFAKIKLEQHPDYDLLISVHDEIVSEVNEGCGDESEFERIMSDLPACMEGCPITAESKRYVRYRK